MTLPKGYVPPNKKATDEKAKQLADEKAKQLADEKAKQLADEKAKQLADEKAIPKINDAKTISTEVLDKKSESQNITNDVNFNTSYPIDYAKIWDEMKKAYMQTVKEATTSYLRLMDFWIKDFKK
jgi:hypothetical protein